MDVPFLEKFAVNILSKIPLQVIFWGSILTLGIVLFIIFRYMLNTRGE